MGGLGLQVVVQLDVVQVELENRLSLLDDQDVPVPVRHHQVGGDVDPGEAALLGLVDQPLVSNIDGGVVIGAAAGAEDLAPVSLRPEGEGDLL